MLFAVAALDTVLPGQMYTQSGVDENGVERQHEQLKYSYLVHVSGGSLEDLVTVVVKQLVPDSEKRYVCSYGILCTVLSSSTVVIGKY